MDINNLLSARGNVYGVQFYPNSNIRIHSNVDISLTQIHGGAYLTGKDLLKLKQQMVPNTVPRVCLVDIWNDHKDNKQNVQFIGDNINMKSECVTQYEDCTFAYWKTDESYTFDDILNDDYITDKNNENCVFDVDVASVLTALSKTSEYDMKSLDLLTSQTLNKQIKVANINNDNYNNYSVLTVIIMAVIVTSIKCMLSSRKKSVMNTNLSEQSPLLV